MSNQQITATLPTAVAHYSAAVSILALGNEGLRIALSKNAVAGVGGDLVSVYGVEDLTIAAGTALPTGAQFLGRLGTASSAGQPAPAAPLLAPIQLTTDKPLPAGLVFGRDQVGAGTHTLQAFVTGDAGASSAAADVGILIAKVNIVPLTAGASASAVAWVATENMAFAANSLLFIPTANFTANNTNYNDLDMATHLANGNTDTVVLQATTQVTGTGSIGNVNAYAQHPLTHPAFTVNAGESVEFVVSPHVSTSGQAMPAFSICGPYTKG
jgi:hypothetical protein